MNRLLLSCAMHSVIARGSMLTALRESAPIDPAKLVPFEGVLAEDKLLEAKTGELYALMELVRAALRLKLYPGNTDRWVNVKAIYQDQVICVSEAGRYMSYPYTIGDDNKITLGEPTEVVEEYSAVKVTEALAQLVEAKEGTAKFEIRVIQAGLSLNRVYYSDSALKEAVPMFNGVRVFLKSDDDHIKGKGKDVSKLVGRLSEAKFIAGKTADTGEVRATLEFIEDTDPLATKMREALAKDMGDLFGFSIDADAYTKKRIVESAPVKFVHKFKKVNSVDCIVEPGAGGALVRLMEAATPDKTTENDPMRGKLIAKINKHLPAKRLAALGNLEELTDDKLLEAFNEAVAIEASQVEASAGAAQSGGVTQEQLREAIAVSGARNYGMQQLMQCKLPQASKDRLLEAFTDNDKLSNDLVDEAIKAEGSYVAKLTESGRVQGLGDIHVEDDSIKVGDMLDAFFDPKHKNHRDVQSFKECYIRMTGDKRVTGQISHCDKSRMAEALGTVREALDSTSLSNVLGDSITRRMVADYRVENQYDSWRVVVGEPVPLSDFRTQERTRFGGYGDLPTVAENDPYPDLASPDDEKATYAPSKRGGLERVSLEMVKNDDVGVIRRIPTKLSQAAKRTLAKFVFDFFRTNPVIYDGVALYHATHGNLGTTAFSAAQWSAHRLLMLKQTERDSNERIGIAPSILLVSADGVEAATDAFKQNTNLEKTFVQSNVPQIIAPWYWTDANDFCTVAAPSDVPTLEIGFLDGQQEPELFVQDSPTVGSLFSNDQITWKIRHIYGGNVVEYRGTTKGVVA